MTLDFPSHPRDSFRRRVEEKEHQEPGVVQEIETLRAHVLRVQHLRELFQHFEEIPDNVTKDVDPHQLKQDLQDVETLMRAYELHVSDDTQRKLVERVVVYFSRRNAAKDLLHHFSHVGEYYDDAWRRTPSALRSSLSYTLAHMQSDGPYWRTDAFVRDEKNPFGILDSDVRDRTLSRIPELATSHDRKDAVIRFLDIDANACLQQLESFGLDPSGEQVVIEQVAQKDLEVIPFYLPEIARKYPDLGKRLLEHCVQHGLFVGSEAVRRYPFEAHERSLYEHTLIEAHPYEAIEHRKSLVSLFEHTSFQEAMALAFQHVEKTLPVRPVDRLVALDRLTEHDADIADLLAPVLHKATQVAVEELTPEFYRLRHDIAVIEKMKDEEVYWDGDIFHRLLMFQKDPYSADTKRIQATQQLLGNPRAAELIVNFFALSIDEGPIFFETTRTPTRQRVILEEAMEKKKVRSPRPEQSEDWVGWGELVFAPRTPEEETQMRAYIERVIEVSPNDFVLALSKLPRTMVKKYIGALHLVNNEQLWFAVLLVDDQHFSKLLGSIDERDAKWIIERVLADETSSGGDKEEFISLVPLRHRKYLVAPVQTYIEQGLRPYALFPDARIAVKMLVLGSRFMQQFAELPEGVRAGVIQQYRELVLHHQSRAYHAIMELSIPMFEHLHDGIFLTVDRLLTLLPQSFTRKAGGDRESGKEWDRIQAFIPYCSPDRVEGLVAQIGPQLEKLSEKKTKGTKGDSFYSKKTLMLLAFRLDVTSEDLTRRYPFLVRGKPYISAYKLAEAASPLGVLELMERRAGELAEYLADEDTQSRFIEYLIKSKNPEQTWLMLKRFADSYSSFVPEAERRTKITRELLGSSRRTIDRDATVRYLIDTSGTVVPITEELARARFEHPVVVEGRLQLSSLTDEEIGALVYERLHRQFDESLSDRCRADVENRAFAQSCEEGEVVFSPGSLVHYTSSDALSAIIAEGNCCGETIGIQSATDSFPLFVDTILIREEDGEVGPQSISSHKGSFQSFSTFDRGVALVYSRRNDTQSLYFDEEAQAYHRAEVHRLCFVGVPHSELGAIVLTEQIPPEQFDDVLEKTKHVMVKRGMYVPVVKASGELLFTPEEFDERDQDAHPYDTVDDLLRDTSMIDHLDVEQPSVVHEHSLRDHLLIAEQHVVELCDEFGIQDEHRVMLRIAARFHDIGKLEAHKSGQEIVNVIGAERELSKVRSMNPEMKRRILVLIRHDELLGSILQETSLQEHGSFVCSPQGRRSIAEFRSRFPNALSRTLLRVLYEADVMAIGNGMHARWQVREKLDALSDQLFKES